MYMRSIMKYISLILGALVLLFSLAMPTFAETVEQTEVQEVVLTAEYPPDFDRVIVVTAASLDTGFIYSYYLRPESNYETYVFMPYGEYSIAASISPIVDGSDDGTVYLVKPATNVFTVEKASYTLGLGFTVEGYTDTDQGDDLPNSDDPTTDDPSSSGASSGGSQGSTNGSSDNIDNPSNSDQSSDNNFTDPVEAGKSKVFKSLIFSVLAILIFFVCGMKYRKYKEG